jgi:hypothetical protein
LKKATTKRQTRQPSPSQHVDLADGDSKVVVVVVRMPLLARRLDFFDWWARESARLEEPSMLATCHHLNKIKMFNEKSLKKNMMILDDYNLKSN